METQMENYDDSMMMDVLSDLHIGLHQINNYKDPQKIILFQKTYLDLLTFIDYPNYKEYINFVINNKDKYALYIKSLDDTQLEKWLDTFLNQLRYSKRALYYADVIFDTDIIPNHIFNIYQNIKHKPNFLTLFQEINIVFEQKIIRNHVIDYALYISDAYNLLKKVNRNLFVTYCTNVLNKSIIKLNLDVTNITTPMIGDYQLTNILVLLIYFMNDEDGVIDPA
jgi:hypothetical protein